MATANQLPLQRVPVTVVGGYLGAGKTTLINRLLADDHGLRIAVLVNDFGEINVDEDLIVDHDGQTLALTNGCVCCSITDDLGGALATISSRARRADHIVLEASGVADPGRIANYAYGQPGLALDGVVILADCETVETRAGDRFVGPTVRRQLSTADILLLTKTDLVGAAHADRTADQLRRDHPNTPVIRGSDAAIRWDAVLGVGMRPNAFLGALPLKEPHNYQFATTTWWGDDTLNRDLFIALLRSWSSTLLRCKGWVRFEDTPETSTLVQMVGSRVELIRDSECSGERLHGLSFIFLREALSATALSNAMSGCRSSGLVDSIL